ncbi:acyl-CoA dehydrogenase [Parvibaculum sp.]|uniref:acyl-CoA dehydrogenase n=1 Tax=Parvibaculum sp. TaxID=2024848 RepID=UPI002730702A|nr:acyl-CoA dehydrogenase [Parvibaculum sp.]MDP1626267.1 acyl-CoA dehydrogenase [Parvibaculum sp.]MDP2151585.1 acyl-CoA dehydrogenase [Parvibaculum sp.]MDP3329004.1 acyl-CoA dehydrogenase [Parvibaculum sp.]
MDWKEARRNYLTRPIFGWASRVLPSMSETEREALEAGDIWWEADLFTGDPGWEKLLATPKPQLSEEEQAFMDGPVEELCDMLDDWKITWEDGDLPEDAWDFIKANRFFGMIIPKRYGGLEFSAFAHSEVIRKLSSRSAAGAVTVMVPNSLGPGELLMQFGTEEQREYWLPRLAAGEEIPCFGLTSPEAGSDAAAMVDRGVVCRGTFNGMEVVGIRLNWNKRYITLAPVATVLGLAFKLSDPDRLLGGDEEPGITVALVPADLPGVTTGRRHLPSFQMFQNGPTQGDDVFIPLDYVIGGAAQVGKGWKMLMSALAAGRGISLPSLSAAAAAFSARTTGAYARVREQFNLPVGKFEGVQARLGHIAGTAYLLDAGRRLTCAGLDEGRKLAVISAIMKMQATNRMRTAVNDAMDIHAGKGVIDGPSNYLGNLYRAVPVGITVEGANILTRNLIVFGQGAIRSHPHLLKEMEALEEEDRDVALAKFDEAFWRHVGHSMKTMGRAWLRNWTGGLVSPAPGAGKATRYYRQLSRHAAGFALVADLALLTLGGGLKRKEMLSARLGDILSELYLMSAVLKRWEDEGRQTEDLPLVAYCAEESFATIDLRFAEVFANLPNRFVAALAKLIVQPLGPRRRGPKDRLAMQCAELLLAPSATRDRLTSGLHLGRSGDAVATLEQAFSLSVLTEKAREKMRAAKIGNPEVALASGYITAEDVAMIAELKDAVAKVVAVDDFAPEDLALHTTAATPGDDANMSPPQLARM